MGSPERPADEWRDQAASCSPGGRPVSVARPYEYEWRPSAVVVARYPKPAMKRKGSIKAMHPPVPPIVRHQFSVAASAGVLGGNARPNTMIAAAVTSGHLGTPARGKHSIAASGTETISS